MRKFEGRGVKRSELSHTSRFTLQTSRSSGGRTRTFTRLLNREPPYHWATPESAKRPVGVEPTLPPRQGSRLPLHHGRKKCITTKLSKIKDAKASRAPSRNRTRITSLRRRSLAVRPSVLVSNCFSGIGENRTHIARIKSPMHYLVCHNPMCCRRFVSVGVAGIEPATVAL